MIVRIRMDVYDGDNRTQAMEHEETHVSIGSVLDAQLTGLDALKARAVKQQAKVAGN